MSKLFAAVTIITFENKETLILKRANNPLDPWAGHLSLPGGKIEKGESPLQAAMRETLEESGINLKISELQSQLPIEIAGANISSSVKVQPYHFNLDYKPEIILELAEHQEYYWVSCEYLFNPKNHTSKQLSKDLPGKPFNCIDIQGTPLWGFTYKVLKDFYDWNF
ncbi:MAG: NUDIX domain-containing protein [Lentisphaeraceae bacterium]|nr:NUDIX domain-containing protein [Lentisphaeraceae bacterium]